MESVSWYDAIEFCNALSVLEGLSVYYNIDKVNQDPNNNSFFDTKKWTITVNASATGYRLPTEAQWEYAAKGGPAQEPYTYSGSNNADAVAWYDDNSGSRTHEVGTKAENVLGLHDMSGNVSEWCWDWHGLYTSEAKNDPKGASSGEGRVVRGGVWFGSATYLRCVYRLVDYPNNRHDQSGFRVVLP